MAFIVRCDGCGKETEDEFGHVTVTASGGTNRGASIRYDVCSAECGVAKLKSLAISAWPVEEFARVLVSKAKP